MLQINIEKTKRYYNINTQISLNNLTLVYGFLPPKMIRFFHKYVQKCDEYLYKQSLIDLIPNGKLRYLIRVDDFPRWDLGLGEFYEFHDIMVSNNVDYVIGLTPFLSFYEPKFNRLMKIILRQLKS